MTDARTTVTDGECVKLAHGRLILKIFETHEVEEELSRVILVGTHLRYVICRKGTDYPLNEWHGQFAMQGRV